MSTINYLQGYAFAKKKGDTIHVFEGPHTLLDFAPVIAEGTDVPRMLKDRFSDVVNVKDFGARGDGVHDDTSAFEAAVATGRIVYIPTGSYSVSDTNVLLKPHIADLDAKVGGLQPAVCVLTGSSTLLGCDIVGLKNVDLSTAQLTLIGRGVGRNLGAGCDSTTAVGQGCLSGESIDDALSDYSPYTGNDNVILGFHAGKRLTSGSSNVGIGRDSLNCLTDGEGNTAIGATSLQQLFHGDSNTCIGRRAGMRMGTTVDAEDNRVSTESVSNNTLVGESAGRELRTGIWNTYVGQGAGRGVTSEETPKTGTSTGQRNTVIGGNAFSSVSSGSHNVVAGQAAGNKITSGSYNVIIGSGCAQGITETQNAVIIGSFAVQSTTSANNAIIIGNNVYKGVDNLDNRFVVGGDGGLAFLSGDMGQDSGNYLRVNASYTPAQSEIFNLGTANYKWNTVFASTGSIVTSDSRCKSSVASASDTLLDAVGNVSIHTFQFTDAVEKKGAESARFHVGVIAQEVASAFEAQGLDAARYGLFCHDEWKDEYETVEVVDQPEVLGKDGEVVTPAVTHTEQKKILSAGDRYGIRYEELLTLECARLRRELDRIKTALTANGITV